MIESIVTYNIDKSFYFCYNIYKKRKGCIHFGMQAGRVYAGIRLSESKEN